MLAQVPPLVAVTQKNQFEVWLRNLETLDMIREGKVFFLTGTEGGARTSWTGHLSSPKAINAIKFIVQTFNDVTNAPHDFRRFYRLPNGCKNGSPTSCCCHCTFGIPVSPIRQISHHHKETIGCLRSKNVLFLHP